MPVPAVVPATAPQPSSSGGGAIITITDHGFSPNPLKISLSDSGGAVTFRNLTTTVRSVIGLGGWSALNSGNIQPGGSYSVNIAALSMCQYSYQSNDAGKTHVQGQIVIGQ